jgi:uncharacterized protein YbaP (TraB family)
MGIKTPERFDPFGKGILMLQRFVLRSKLSVVVFVCFLPAFFMAATFCWQIKPAAGQEAHKSCLWSIEGQSNKIHLLGSLHFFKPDAFPLADAIERAYADSQRLVFETDIAAMQDPAVQTRMMELGMYPEGQGLWQNLDPGTRQLLEKKITEFGLPLEAFSRFKPWFVAVQIEIVQLLRLGFSPQYGIDVHFFDRAKSAGKEVGFLESTEFQIDLFGSMDKQDQNAFLNQTLKELELADEMAGGLIKFWKAGDAARLHDLLSKSFKNYPVLYDRLLIQRNKNWVKEIEGAMRKNKNTLFVVGAGHLVGPKSVVDLLEKKGYRVKQQ